MNRCVVWLFICLPLYANAEAVMTAADAEAGEGYFEERCQFCHGGSLPEAPRLEALRLFPPERIVESLTSGVMSTAGLTLSRQNMRQVAFYLTGKTVSAPDETAALNYCTAADAPRDAPGSASWTGWGNQGGRRHQSNETRITRDTVSSLELDWVFAFPGSTRSRAQPTVTAETTYVGSQDGTVYALNTRTGCVRWIFVADGEVRGALALTRHESADRDLLLFGDFGASAYALDASTGELLWKTRVHEHALATITGSVTADTSRVYVPVSSSEVVPAALPDYPCCTFRGALVALDLADGALVWRSYTTDKPQPQEPSAAGTRQFGPSGAPIWSAPTLDPKRGVVLATTGQNYSSPATGTSDAVIAFDIASGEVRWVSQVTANDAWNGACGRKTANCPREQGPDFDIGASAVLVTLRDGSERIFAGQKSGMVYSMDPDDNGRILWSKRVGSGGTMGGVHWGMSADEDRLYVGVSDAPTRNPYIVGEPQPGMNALDMRTGEFIWRNQFPYACDPNLKFACWQGISAAVSSSPGLVFAGGLDGRLRALDAESGEELWSYETLREYETVNGVRGQGGAIEADGPVIANGRVFVTSGYDKWGELPGNVLLVFAPRSH